MREIGALFLHFGIKSLNTATKIQLKLILENIFENFLK